ncbi:hypothetical protein ILYODFUR_037054 [Ilyodon furcidens]|uniref:Uncharacterized protein n=1 Tax=Ilyodon furcidens TaxID=33524 RepID=A0ABV0V979_9TELE
MPVAASAGIFAPEFITCSPGKSFTRIKLLVNPTEPAGLAVEMQPSLKVSLHMGSVILTFGQSSEGQQTPEFINPPCPPAVSEWPHALRSGLGGRRRSGG